ncbi:prostaglandin F2 receptor negative regulator [Lates japonicus]|uniref:Prostaglandin F2 receptor negative regulator n=1 Tax=Lates japonicus TaxID=270547 RepID=A0AAD3N125_LATJO|nr:prostaglandin F2 receptor negative regulator [Lates japonicus]
MDSLFRFYFGKQTPESTDHISGNYEVQVHSTVIPTPSRKSPHRPHPKRSPEEVTSHFPASITLVLTHPTYLSVTWLLKSGRRREGTTFGPQEMSSTGTKFARRYADGASDWSLGRRMDC